VERIILDVDLAMGAPGSDIDDGFALALALADPGIQVDLVTTVNGNTDVATATTLTLELLHQLGRSDIPVHRGAQRPLIRPQARQGVVPEGIPAREPHPAAAAVAMVDHVRANPGEITVVAVGPLTNVALAVRLDPSFAANLKQLVIMGGVFDGHTHRASMPGEFNIWNDPEAADIVLTSGVAAHWVGLDVTLQVRVSRGEAKAMEASDKPFESFAGRYTAAWIDHLNVRNTEQVDSCAMHDPLAVAAVTHPEFLTWVPAYLQVETGDRMRGAFVTDYLESDWAPDESRVSLSPNALVARAVDAAAFHEFFLTKIKELS
jgi:inosine-uridine nucleoside N-ribohydrolase